MNITYLLCLFSLSSLLSGPLMLGFKDLMGHIEECKLQSVFEDMGKISAELDCNPRHYEYAKNALERGTIKKLPKNKYSSKRNDLFIIELLYVAALDPENSETPPCFHESLLKKHPGIENKFRDLRRILRLKESMTEDDYENFCYILESYWYITISEETTSKDLADIVLHISQDLVMCQESNPSIEALMGFLSKLNEDQAKKLVYYLLFQGLRPISTYKNPYNLLPHVLSRLKYPGLSGLLGFYRDIVVNGMSDDTLNMEDYLDRLSDILDKNKGYNGMGLAQKSRDIKAQVYLFMTQLADKALSDLIYGKEKDKAFNLSENLFRARGIMGRTANDLRGKKQILATVFDPVGYPSCKVKLPNGLRVFWNLINNIRLNYEGNEKLQAFANKLENLVGIELVSEM